MFTVDPRKDNKVIDICLNPTILDCIKFSEIYFSQAITKICEERLTDVLNYFKDNFSLSVYNSNFINEFNRSELYLSGFVDQLYALFCTDKFIKRDYKTYIKTLAAFIRSFSMSRINDVDDIEKIESLKKCLGCRLPLFETYFTYDKDLWELHALNNDINLDTYHLLSNSLSMFLAVCYRDYEKLDKEVLDRKIKYICSTKFLEMLIVNGINSTGKSVEFRGLLYFTTELFEYVDAPKGLN